MKTKPIRLLSVYLVLFIFLFNNFGRVVIFKLLETTNANNIERIIASGDNSKLLKLAIPRHELNNKEIFAYQEEEVENEILYKWRIFNVAKEEVTDEGITFYCINDPYEEALIVKLNDSEKEDFNLLPSSAPVNQFSKKINDYFAIKFFTPDNSEIILFTYNRHGMPDYNDVFLEVITPPPLHA